MSRSVDRVRTLSLILAFGLVLAGCGEPSERVHPLDRVTTLEEALAAEEFDRAASLFPESFWLIESLFDANHYSDDDGVALADVLAFNGLLLDWEFGECRQVQVTEGTQITCPDGTLSGELPTALGIDQPLPVPFRFTVTDKGILTFLPDRDELESRPDAEVTLAAFSELFAFLGWVGENAPDADDLFVQHPHLVAVSEATALRLLELATWYLV